MKAASMSFSKFRGSSKPATRSLLSGRACRALAYGPPWVPTKWPGNLACPEEPRPQSPNRLDCHAPRTVVSPLTRGAAAVANWGELVGSTVLATLCNSSASLVVNLARQLKKRGNMGFSLYPAVGRPHNDYWNSKEPLDDFPRCLRWPQCSQRRGSVLSLQQVSRNSSIQWNPHKHCIPDVFSPSASENSSDLRPFERMRPVMRNIGDRGHAQV